MAEDRNDPEVFWVDPKVRGIIPLNGFRMSRSLRRRIRRDDYRVTLNEDFEAVVTGCAEREETWINATIFDLYLQLHLAGVAHSIEVWQENRLAGGVYGVALGAAFFGESMFSAATDGSKIALAYLVDHLRGTGFQLFDTQFVTPHLVSLGAVEISRNAYHLRLRNALAGRADILSRAPGSAQDVIQRNTQTS